MKSRSGILIAAIFVLFSLTLAIPGSFAISHPTFAETVTPSSGFVGTNQTFYVNVTDVTGYTNYSVDVYASGNNLTGMSPATSYQQLNGNNRTFSIEFTAPTTAQNVRLEVISYGEYEGTVTSASQLVTIQIVNTINLSAKITNPSGVTIKNLTVNFELNGNIVGTRTVSNLSSGQTITVNYTYVPDPTLFKSGEYTMQITTNNPIVQSSTVTGKEYRFYYGTPPNYNWILYVAGVVVIFMIFLAITAGRRGGGGSGLPAPKWRR